MTEKQFKVEKEIFDGYCIVDSNDEGYYAYEKHDLERLCDSLNEFVTKYYDLEKENEQLKSRNKKLLEENYLLKEYVEKENEQLKKENNNIHNINKEYRKENLEIKEECIRLRKENEQLKKILNELSDMLQFDVENGIRSYPVELSEYLSNALKELIK